MKKLLPLLLLAAVACGSNSSSGGNTCTAANATATTTVDLKNIQFSPQCIVVSQGSTVTFVNQDTIAHRIATTGSPAVSFDLLNQDAGVSVTTPPLNATGTINVICTYHPQMNLTIIVQSGGTGSTTTTTGGSTGCTSSNATQTTSVSIVDYAFNPNCILVNAGSNVTWTNNGAATHEVASDPNQTESFDNGAQAPAANSNHVFNTAGTTGIHCAIHTSMKMTVIAQ